MKQNNSMKQYIINAKTEQTEHMWDDHMLWFIQDCSGLCLLSALYDKLYGPVSFTSKDLPPLEQ